MVSRKQINPARAVSEVPKGYRLATQNDIAYMWKKNPRFREWEGLTQGILISLEGGLESAPQKVIGGSGTPLAKGLMHGDAPRRETAPVGSMQIQGKELEIPGLCVAKISRHQGKQLLFDLKFREGESLRYAYVCASNREPDPRQAAMLLAISFALRQ